jgi:glycosyltransferase involved in cell wall biosynthesis
MTDPKPSRRPWRIAHSEASCGWGGQEHRVMAELRGFQQRGCPVWVMAETYSQVYQRAQEFGIGTVPVRFKKSRMLLDAVRLAGWLRRERIDVLNTHSSRDGWLLGLAGRLARVPLLIRSRHIDVDYPNPSISKHAFTTFADHVLTTSQKITGHFQRIFPLTNDRITTLPTGIDVQRFHPQGGKADLSLRPDVPVVGMVSVLRSWKGHPIFFEAARLLHEAGRRAQFVVVGGGAPVERFQALAAQHGAGDLIQFAGHREDIPDVLRSLDLLVIASTRHEGVPQIGLQALACQTPVVGSDCGGIPEIIRDGVTGRIVPAGDAAALARRIGEALDEKERTQTLTLEGRQMVEREHSLETMLDRLDALYHRYLTSPTC